MEYFRIHANYCGRTGKPVGIFVAVDHLRRADRLTPEEVALYHELDAWYKKFLPEPPIYHDGNSQLAITWFKDTPKGRAVAARLHAYVAILTKYEVEHQVSRTSDPGEVIYEDEWQAAAI